MSWIDSDHSSDSDSDTIGKSPECSGTWCSRNTRPWATCATVCGVSVCLWLDAWPMCAFEDLILATFSSGGTKIVFKTALPGSIPPRTDTIRRSTSRIMVYLNKVRVTFFPISASESLSDKPAYAPQFTPLFTPRTASLGFSITEFYPFPLSFLPFC